MKNKYELHETKVRALGCKTLQITILQLKALKACHNRVTRYKKLYPLVTVRALASRDLKKKIYFIFLDTILFILLTHFTIYPTFLFLFLYTI